MIGTGHWATGITCIYDPDPDHTGQPGWCATLKFLDGGFCNDNADTGQVSTEGTLTTRYYVRDGHTTSGLTAALDALIADATRLGINFPGPAGGQPMLYVPGDGEHPNVPLPDGWFAELKAQAARLGWQTYSIDWSRAKDTPTWTL